VGGAGAECDAETYRALRVDEGLLARLSVEDASAEVDSIASAAWAFAAVSGVMRPGGVPAPLETLHAGLEALRRRLYAELSTAAEIQGHKKGSGAAMLADQEAGKRFQQEETGRVQKFQEQARSLRETSLASLTSELEGACAEGSEVLGMAETAVQEALSQTEALDTKRKAQAVEAESSLRNEREAARAQVVALEELTLKAQIEKERLEAALAEKKPRPKVFHHVLAAVKQIQTQLREQEVSGKTNRTNQGILVHSLRILESRAAKAEGECRRKGLILGTGRHGDPEEAGAGDEDDFVPSAQVRKKQESRAEEETQFRAALEAELTKLRADLANKARKEVAELGAQLRSEAEAHCAAVSSAICRLTTWQRSAGQSRPWLAELVPVANASGTIAAAAVHVRACCAGATSACDIRAVITRLEASCRQATAGASAASGAETPRQGALGPMLNKLESVQVAIAKLRKDFPDLGSWRAAGLAVLKSKGSLGLGGAVAAAVAVAAASPRHPSPSPDPSIEVDTEPSLADSPREGLPHSRSPRAQAGGSGAGGRAVPIVTVRSKTPPLTAGAQAAAQAWGLIPLDGGVLPLGDGSRPTSSGSGPPSDRPSDTARRSDKVGVSLRPSLQRWESAANLRAGTPPGIGVGPSLTRIDSEPALKSPAAMTTPTLARPASAVKLSAATAQGPALRAVQKARRNMTSSISQTKD